MDPFSISVRVITLIQVTTEIGSLCCNYLATAKGAARSILEVVDELKSLRNVLESLENLLRSSKETDPATKSQYATIMALCDVENGPVAKELKYLDKKLRPSNWASRDGSKRKALVQSLTWPLKEGETKKAKPRRRWKNIERLKSTLELALTVDQT